ncbi:MAG TPA: RNA-binding S4 domain-containing protein [Rhizomicrobium sp.]|nr:RNA-binding S4 domain-containing protein [Rhizomicrobium sp.]
MTTARLDKWLFCARFYRTRTIAQEATAAGKVRLNGTRVDRPGHALRPGDVLTLGRGAEMVAVRVLALAERRGPATEARALYEVIAE